MFTTLLAFMVAFNSSTIKVPQSSGQYYQMVNYQYDPVENKTYGIFVRYDKNSGIEMKHMQLRSLPGNVSQEDLNNDAKHDSGITLVR